MNVIMAVISQIDILEEFMQQINEQFPYEKHFIKCLQEFSEIIKSKDIMNSVSLEDLNEKLTAAENRQKYLQDELKTLEEQLERELNFKNKIISQNNELTRKEQEQHFEQLTRERKVCEQEINLRKETFEFRETQEYKPEIERSVQQLESTRFQNVAEERIQRIKWMELKEELSTIKASYEIEMLKLQEKLKYIQQLHENETKELQYFKNLFEAEDEEYHELMKEKEEYLERVRQQKLYEIRVKMASRAIVKFVEQNYPAWKKKKTKAIKKKSKYRFRK